MSAAESPSGTVRPTKPTTRSSIRHSLNLSSVGKALVDVMNKEGERGIKRKGKDPNSRRMSAMGLVQPGAGPRQSMGDSKSPSTTKRSETPESKTVTRHSRRSSVIPKPGTSSSDELGVKAPESTGVVTRSSTLRPRNANASSALPKYRPKPTADTMKKPPSPSTRTRSDDDEKEFKMKVDTQRTALKVNLTSVINVSPSTPTSKSSSKTATPSPGKSSPTRKPAKAASVHSANISTLPRLPSSSSSSSLRTPRTPKTPSSLKTALGLGRSGRDTVSPVPSPLRNSVRPPPPESPLAHHSRKFSKAGSSTTASTNPSPTSQYIDVNSEDSMEADDVELLLAPVASLAAPTPAIPRIQTVRSRPQQMLQTPTRPANTLPGRANLSYLSPMPPSSDDSPFLRPKARTAGNDRGSILSWEQLASESSRTLGVDEIDTMLADIPAPFQSAGASRTVSPSPVSPSPRPMQLDIPESPCLSSLPSPGGYGSISQVLLPDVTPSPAPHLSHTQLFDSVSQDIPAVDAAIVTLLRLQLASAENMAKERLGRIQSLEEELHSSKGARIREAEDLAKQVSLLEERLQHDVEIREHNDEERAAYTAALEDQIRHDQAFRDEAVQVAVNKAQENARLLQTAAVKQEQRKWEVASIAQDAGISWNTVRELAESELDLLGSNKEMLTVLLAGLDQCQRQLS